MATLINGDGNAAVYAAQDADYYAGVEGDVTKILPVGLKMAYEIEDANTIAIKNGVIITKEGRRIQLDAGSIDEFTIPTGSQGITKYYIIGYHLYTDSSSNQLCETFVQLMTSESETITENTFRGGSDEVYVSVYRVTQEGLALTTIESLLPEGIAIGDLDGIIGDTDISGIGDGTLTGAIDTINSDLTELDAEVNKGYVEVTASGSETYSTLLNRLFALIDATKINSKSTLILSNYVGNLMNVSDSQYMFTTVWTAGNSMISTSTFVVKSSSSGFYVGNTTTNATSYVNYSSNTVTAGQTARIEY